MTVKSDSPLGAVFASPNHGERAEGVKPEMIVLHYTGMPNAKSALKWLCNPESSVSCHYFIYETGKILQLVPESRRAWHAGAGSWRGQGDINSRSIGIELCNLGHEGGRVDPDDPRKPLSPESGPTGLPAFPDKQIASLVNLLGDICDRNGIARRNILAHSDIAPKRKRDPGEAFPWEILARHGLGLWTPAAPIRSGRALRKGDAGAPVAFLQQMLSMLGYAIDQTGVYDDDTAAVVTAFQRHWRQERVDAIADPSTVTTLRDVIRAMT